MKQKIIHFGRAGGAALVIALAFLVIIAAMALAFFSSARSDRQNASVFASAQDTLRLTDTAVSVVMSQIRDATISQNTAWASQPGMIRVYDTTGNLVRAFKLYSSDDMTPVLFGTAQQSAELSAMANWQTQPAHFVDLNAPAVVPQPNPANPSTTINETFFPIVDPRAAAIVSGSSLVEGFSYSGTSGTNTISGVVTTSGSASDSQRLPMPVKWLYVLRDGSLTTPDAAAGATEAANFTTEAVLPSKNNPIVGRIAFWTDDDTSKVNINTASEGSFWDIPCSVASTEAAMAFNVPVKGEFQACASHPATTCLSTVLGGPAGTPGLIPRPASDLAAFQIATSDYTNYFAPYYTLTPRISDNAPGGTTSRAGSTQTVATNFGLTPFGSPVSYDTDRLYATTDELLFAPDRTVNTPLPGNPLTATAIAQRNFFLTANSRAPETTLFGTPRICLWPIQNLQGTTVSQTSRDQLIAFCSTIGTNPYYFQRNEVAVCQTGTLANPSAGSMTEDYNLIPRNQNLYSYLNNMLQQNVPGFGSSFAAKWSNAGTARIATMAFDYIHSSLNLFETPNNTVRNGLNCWGFEVPVPPGSNQGGFIMPLNINGNIGFGRNTGISEVAIVFMAAAADPSTKATTAWQAFMLFNLYRPVVESSGAAPGLHIKVSSPFGINGEILAMKRMGGPLDGRNFAFAGPHALLNKNTYTDYDTRIPGSTDTQNYYPFYGPVVTTNPGDTTFNFAGGLVTVNLMEPYGSGTIQTLNLTFPPVTLPLPQSVDPNGNFVSGTTSPYAAMSFQSRLPIAPAGPLIVNPGDIVRSMRFSSGTSAPHKGDLRLLMLNTSINSPSDGWFETNPQYYSLPAIYTFSGTASSGTAANAAARTNRFAHTLRDDFVEPQIYSWSDGINGTSTSAGFARAYISTGFNNAITTSNPPQNDLKITPGGLIAPSTANPTTLILGNNSDAHAMPVIPQGLPAALNINGNPGDFNNSYGFVGDGATVSIPDFGAFSVEAAGYYTPQTAGGEEGQGAEPNRQVPSAVIFGTLPSPGPTGNPAPWQTLLFDANPAAGTAHPGFGTGVGGPGPTTQAPFSLLPDHLFLDYWWMPAVDPYAISDPLSTAGKVNLNYKIEPFLYIQRETAVHAVMKSVRMAGYVDSDSYRYKAAVNAVPNDPSFYVPASVAFQTRQILNLSSTNGSLAGFETRFATGDIFRSASEICTIPLVPDGQTTSTMATWWRTRRLTGDNLRKSPYNSIYSRVTTKSNTFTVHYRVQALKQVSGGTRNWSQWVEGYDQVVGEYRGATTIERYLDPQEPGIPDYATATNPPPIDTFYRFRVLSTRQFAP